MQIRSRKSKKEKYRVRVIRWQERREAKGEKELRGECLRAGLENVLKAFESLMRTFPTQVKVILTALIKPLNTLKASSELHT